MGCPYACVIRVICMVCMHAHTVVSVLLGLLFTRDPSLYKCPYCYV